MTDEAARAAVRIDDGYHAVFVEHHARLVRLGYLLCGDAHRAEDVAADAFVRVYPHWREGRVADVGAYLRKAVANGLREQHRRSTVRDIRPVADPDPGAVDAVEGATVEQQRVLAALRRLPEEQRLVVVLRIWDDLSEAATAEILGVAVGTVKSRTARAVERLRQLLEEADHD